jgi:fused signal recognition particle receptor
MFKFKRQKTSENNSTSAVGLFGRLQAGLKRTRDSIRGEITTLLKSNPKLDDELLNTLEERLILADVGAELASAIIAELPSQLPKGQSVSASEVLDFLQQALVRSLQACEQPSAPATTLPHVILMVGVNGAGKTTTIGKIAKQYKQAGKRVLLAAGDTYRAAAVEQLQVWGERNEIPVIAQASGADSAAVIYDAVSSAKARGFDVVLADTAGRLHTQDKLMEEIKKVKRVCQKISSTYPHEILLVLDAGIGQNAISQTQQFHQALGLTGLVLTKLDGTAKGGVIFALAKTFGLPIRYLGVGEGIDDLRPFNAREFVQALFGPESGET